MNYRLRHYLCHVRRLFVTFGNGDVGVLNSLRGMSTNEIVALAKALGAQEAVYMDTGMYNDGVITFPSGARERLGSRQAEQPTNFLGLRVD